MVSFRSFATVAALALSSAVVEARGPVVVPLRCTRGPSEQHYDVTPHVPGEATAGTTYAVRLDGVDSGAVSHVGLRYVKDMTYVFGVPDGSFVIEGTLRLVPGSGSAGLSSSAVLTSVGRTVTLVLPAHVEEGQSYTPPSVEMKLLAAGDPGAALSLTFRQFRVTAHAVLVGDVTSTCTPPGGSYVLGTTRVAAP